MCLPLARLYVSQQRNERLAGLAWLERGTERRDEVGLWGSHSGRDGDGNLYRWCATEIGRQHHP